MIKIIKWINIAALLGFICVVSPVQAYDGPAAGSDYVDAINSEAQSIQRNNMRVKADENSAHDRSRQRLNVEDMLKKLKRLTTHGGH